jgi:hypothetical protein
MRPRCSELARVLKQTGSLYYHCDWHAKKPFDFLAGDVGRLRVVSFGARVGSVGTGRLSPNLLGVA